MPPRLVVAILLVLSNLHAQGIGVVGAGSIDRPPVPQQGQPQGQPAKEQPPGSLEGAVLNAVSGEPLKRANLMLMPAQPRPESSTYTTSTDNAGRFAMNNIAPGTYRLMAERTGYVRLDYGSRGAMRPGSTITLGPGQTMKDLELRMQPHAVIAGRVLDEEGEPMAHVQVQALVNRYMQGRKRLMPSGMGSTNDLGEYRIFGLPPGRYLVSATYRSQAMMMPNTVDRTANANAAAQQDEGYAPTYYPGTNDASAAIPVQIAAGRPVGNMDIKLRRVRTVRVRGNVVNAGTAEARQRTMVMLMPRESMGFGGFERNMSAARGPDGSFEIRGVTPGSYYLIAQHFEAGTQTSARVAVDVGNANLDNVQVVLKPGMEITGQVKFEGATPPNFAQMNVMLQPKDFGPFGGGNSGPGRPDAEGKFTLKNVSPGEYRVFVAVGGSSSVYVKSVQAGQQDVPDRVITIADGAAPMLSVVVSDGAGQVTGQVTAEKPATPQGATVVLLPPADKRERSDLFRMATTDQYGKFTLSSITPGEYTLYAWDNIEPGAWQDPEFVARYENKGKSISVKERDTLTADVPLLKAEEPAN